MASQESTAPTGRSGGADNVRSRTDAENDPVPSAAPEDDFEFCILSSGGLALAGGDAADSMCVADEVFSGGKLLPFRFSSATSADALLRSDSLNGSSTTASTSGFSSREAEREVRSAHEDGHQGGQEARAGAAGSRPGVLMLARRRRARGLGGGGRGGGEAEEEDGGREEEGGEAERAEHCPEEQDSRVAGGDLHFQIEERRVV